MEKHAKTWVMRYSRSARTPQRTPAGFAGRLQPALWHMAALTVPFEPIVPLLAALAVLRGAL